MINKQFRILIVEDEHSIRELYRIKLELEGFRVKTARNGKEGLETAEEFSPDLILLDLKMPEMNGDEMLECMRRTQWGSLPRVLILTNISRDEAPHSLRFLNVDKYVVKAHHTPSQIVEAIYSVLGLKRPM